ncbi:Rid family hydrolase, partial [Herbaspirillum sp. B65]|uniref:Rid family hydrolase n=1 Tax=Herbaspirillum sp. B65 TaxID=137708 RepID=UPI0005CAB319
QPSRTQQVLETAGGKLEDIVDLTTFHTDMRDLPLFIKVRNRYLGAYPLPAWTAIGAHMLGGAPGYIIEIKAVAHLRKKEASPT